MAGRAGADRAQERLRRVSYLGLALAAIARPAPDPPASSHHTQATSNSNRTTRTTRRRSSAAASAPAAAAPRSGSGFPAPPWRTPPAVWPLRRSRGAGSSGAAAADRGRSRAAGTAPAAPGGPHLRVPRHRLPALAGRIEHRRVRLHQRRPRAHRAPTRRRGARNHRHRGRRSGTGIVALSSFRLQPVRSHPTSTTSGTRSSTTFSMWLRTSVLIALQLLGRDLEHQLVVHLEQHPASEPLLPDGVDGSGSSRP